MINTPVKNPVVNGRVTRKGPYDVLYRASPHGLLWGETPTRLLGGLAPIEAGVSLKALDVGCGDGVNSIRLEELGYDVDGVDLSNVALESLRNRFETNGRDPTGRYVCSAIESYRIPKNYYDLVVCCGLYHCISPEFRHSVVTKIVDGLKPGALLLFSTLTDQIPIDESHRTERLFPPNPSEVEMSFRMLRTVSKYNCEIEDSHPPLVGRHKHSVLWLIAQKWESKRDGNTTTLSHHRLDSC